MARFEIGTVVVTQQINYDMKTKALFREEIFDALNKYHDGDWGTLCSDDVTANEKALENPDDLYLMGAYLTSRGKVFIITCRKSEQPGDNVTTICYPEER